MTGWSAEQVIEALGLQPNQTCGFVAPSYSSQLKLREGSLPGPLDGARAVGSALYFLVTPRAPVRLHRIRNDQLYHFYLGQPLEIVMLLPDGSGQRHVVGPDLLGGQRLQLFIPGGTFHTARLLGESGWFLGRQHRVARRNTRRCRAGQRRPVGSAVPALCGCDPHISPTPLVGSAA